MRDTQRDTGNRSFSGRDRLPEILKLNLAFLIGLAALALVLPLSGAERWFLAVSVAVLAGVNWALLERARGRSRLPRGG